MKLLSILRCAIVLAAMAAPASAVNIAFNNHGTVSGDLASGSVVSTVQNLRIGGLSLGSGPIGQLTFTTSPVTNTITGGQLQLDVGGSVLFTTSFNGTWTRLGKGRYQLVGKFSGSQPGVTFTGTTTQLFGCKEDNQGKADPTNLLGLQGRTIITVVAGP